MSTRNPFTPTFGIAPAHLAGRKTLLADMRGAFEDGLGNPNLSTILVGPRGSGKTSLLSCIALEAQARGWISVDVVAAEGMLEDVFQQTVFAASEFIEGAKKTRLSGLGIGQVLELEWTNEDLFQANWRTRMTDVLNRLTAQDVGLLITVDEVNASVDELVRLVSTYQLFIREGKKISLVMAGLPGQVYDLLGHADVSFLRRSSQRFLGRIQDVDVEVAFAQTVSDAGKDIEADALEYAVDAIGGFPYMMQLVGYRTWEACSNAEVICMDHTINGVKRAQRELSRGVFDTTYRELAQGDKNFLFAMLQDEGPSTLGEIAQRMGKKSNYASSYKRRLLKQGIIEDLGGGGLDIALPFFREYLLEKSSDQ